MEVAGNAATSESVEWRTDSELRVSGSDSILFFHGNCDAGACRLLASSRHGHSIGAIPFLLMTQFASKELGIETGSRAHLLGLQLRFAFQPQWISCVDNSYCIRLNLGCLRLNAMHTFHRSL